MSITSPHCIRDNEICDKQAKFIEKYGLAPTIVIFPCGIDLINQKSPNFTYFGMKRIYSSEITEIIVALTL